MDCLRSELVKFKARPRMDSISSFDTTRLRSFALIMLALVERLMLTDCVGSCDSVTALVIIVGPLVTSLMVTRCAFAFAFAFFIVGSSLPTNGSIKMLPVSCTLFLVPSTDASVFVIAASILLSLWLSSLLSAILVTLVVDVSFNWTNDAGVGGAIVVTIFIEVINFAVWSTELCCCCCCSISCCFSTFRSNGCVDVDKISSRSIVVFVTSVVLASRFSNSAKTWWYPERKREKKRKRKREQTKIESWPKLFAQAI